MRATTTGSNKLTTQPLALFEQQGGDWLKFYAAVKKLANMPKEARQAALKQLI
jgi:predicted aminopeptidase